MPLNGLTQQRQQGGTGQTPLNYRTISGKSRHVHEFRCLLNSRGTEDGSTSWGVHLESRRGSLATVI